MLMSQFLTPCGKPAEAAQSQFHLPKCRPPQYKHHQASNAEAERNQPRYEGLAVQPRAPQELPALGGFLFHICRSKATGSLAFHADNPKTRSVDWGVNSLKNIEIIDFVHLLLRLMIIINIMSEHETQGFVFFPLSLSLFIAIWYSSAKLLHLPVSNHQPRICFNHLLHPL